MNGISNIDLEVTESCRLMRDAMEDLCEYIQELVGRTDNK